MTPETATALLSAADALEEAANQPRNQKYRDAYLISARDYRLQAERALIDESATQHL